MFSPNEADRDDRANRGRRCNRTDFWVGAAAAMVMGIALSRFLGSTALLSVVGFSVYLAQGRLQDIGRRGWWVVLLPIGFVLSYVFVQRNPLALGLDISLMALTTLIFLTYVGATPGDAGQNRFGAPPVGVLKAALDRRSKRRAADT